MSGTVATTIPVNKGMLKHANMCYSNSSRKTNDCRSNIPLSIWHFYVEVTNLTIKITTIIPMNYGVVEAMPIIMCYNNSSHC